MRMRLSRRSELFLPLALLIPVCAGKGAGGGGCVRGARACTALHALRCGGLCARCGAGGFATARARRLDGRFAGGTGIGHSGMALGRRHMRMAVCPDAGNRMVDGHMPHRRAAGAGKAQRGIPARQRTAGKRVPERLVRAALLAGGVLCGGVWIAGAAALGWLVSLVVAWRWADARLPFQTVRRYGKCLPRACARCFIP